MPPVLRPECEWQSEWWDDDDGVSWWQWLRVSFPLTVCQNGEVTWRGREGASPSRSKPLHLLSPYFLITILKNVPLLLLLLFLFLKKQKHHYFFLSFSPPSLFFLLCHPLFTQLHCVFCFRFRGLTHTHKTRAKVGRRRRHHHHCHSFSVCGWWWWWPQEEEKEVTFLKNELSSLSLSLPFFTILTAA